MCLILLAHQVNPEFPLMVAANRDEFHARAAAQAEFWKDHPQVLAGRDLQAGGTWLGITRNGRFAAVTNFREDPPDPLPPRSRGALVSDFLTGSEAPEPYLLAVAKDASEYRGFSLLAGNGDELWYYSNRISRPERLAPGTYGLSNHLLDTAWPKVRKGKSALAAFEEAERHPKVDDLLELLGDETVPEDAEIAQTGLDPEIARRVAPCFIRGSEYGTRASTVLFVAQSGRIQFTEAAFGPDGRRSGRRDYSFEIDVPAPRVGVAAMHP